MSSLNEHQRLIKRLTRDHNATIKRLEAARDVCSLGTNSYRQYEQAIAEERRKHVQSLVDFGVIPQNLEAATKTEFLYVAFSNVCPANRTELDALLSKQMRKAAEGLHYDDADEAIRQQLEEDFTNAK